MDERRGDWEHGVDENLASLNAGQRIWDHDLGQIHKTLAEVDGLLRGDPDRDTDGMVARLHQQENEVNLLKAVLLKDKAGNKGLVGRVEALEMKEKSTVEVWKFWVAFIGLIGAISVALITNIDKITAFINRKSNDPVDKAIERAKHPRNRYRHYIIRQDAEID